MKDLGFKIREERKVLGLTLEEFAKLIGTSVSMLQRVETGARSPSVDLLVEIANICRKPIDEFLNNEPTGFKIFDPADRRTICRDKTEISIICPYGLISKDIVVSHFKGNAGARIEPQSHKGFCWVFILKGSCIFEHDGVPYELKKGDSFYYDASKPQYLRVNSTLESIRITIRK